MLRRSCSSLLNGSLKGSFRCFASLPSRSETVNAKPELPEYDHVPQSYTGPSAAEVEAMRNAHVSKSVFNFYKKPLMIVEGKMQYVYDDTGRRYLDGIAGIATISVGHCHPAVVNAMQQQQNRLGHASTAYLHPELALYAKELTSKFPDPLNYAFFVQSGSEANDLAMILARRFTGNFDFVTFRNCYHGLSQVTMGLTAMGNWKQPIPQGMGLHRVAVPNSYRGIFGDDLSMYIRELKETLMAGSSGNIAGFIAEAIQGAGGAVTLLDGYLKQAYEITRQHGGVCIADEVQSGFCRTGKTFWGYESHGVVPDIITTAKGIANGSPLAAVITRKEIADSILGKTYFNTFGGTPPIMAGARAVLKTLEKENLQQNCLKMGNIIKDGITGLMDKHSIIGDMRGDGLMLGVELVKDRSTKQPASAEATEVMEQLREINLLIGKGGMEGNVLRVKPPLCITEEDARFVVEAFDYALNRL